MFPVPLSSREKHDILFVWDFTCDQVQRLVEASNDKNSISYMPKSLEPYQINFMFSGRGRDKVMWGTIGIGLARGKKELMEMEGKDEAELKILRENAVKFLNLGS